MPTKKLKPDTPSRRYMSVSTFEEITKKRPERKLTVAIRKTGGRNNFTLNHLAERIKFYVDEDFQYRMTEITLNSGQGRLDL